MNKCTHVYVCVCMCMRFAHRVSRHAVEFVSVRVRTLVILFDDARLVQVRGESRCYLVIPSVAEARRCNLFAMAKVGRLFLV